MGSYSWLFSSLFQYFPSAFSYPLIAIAAVLCGMLIGEERQRREKPAGLRTVMLVCLGSSVFTMASFIFTTTTGDSGRVAAQIVTGIGFLGAGVILHGKRIVTGTTTAAVIWVTAAIGMIVGAGYVLAGLGLSFAINRLLVLVFLYETRWHPDLLDVSVKVDYEPRNGMTRVRLEGVLVDYLFKKSEMDCEEISPELGRLTLTTRLARAHLTELLSEIVELPGILSINRERCVPVYQKTNS